MEPADPFVLKGAAGQARQQAKNKIQKSKSRTGFPLTKQPEKSISPHGTAGKASPLSTLRITLYAGSSLTLKSLL